MGLLFCDGWGYTDFLNQGEKYQSFFFGSGSNTLTGNVIPGPSAGLSGIQFTGSDPLWAQYPQLASGYDFVIGFYLQPSSISGTQPFFVLQSSIGNLTTSFAMQINSAGNILCGAGFGDNVFVFPAHFAAIDSPSVTSNATLPDGIWTHVAVQVHFSNPTDPLFPNSGYFRLYINGALDSQSALFPFTFVADRPVLVWNTGSGALGISQYVVFGAPGDLPNPTLQIRTIFPTSDTNNGDWVPLSGTANYAMVNSTPGPGSNYIALASLTAPDELFGIPASFDNPTVAVAVNANWGLTSAETLQALALIGGIRYPILPTIPGSSPAAKTTQWLALVNPATGNPWTDQDINAAAWGLRGIMGTGQTVYQWFLEKVTQSGLASYMY